MPKATHDTDRQQIGGFQEIINIGPAMEQDFQRLDLTSPQQLIGQDPLQLYQAICRLDHTFHDPCVLDTYLAAVDFMNGNPPRQWWDYTAERKKRFSNEVDQLRQQYGR